MFHLLLIHPKKAPQTSDAQLTHHPSEALVLLLVYPFEFFLAVLAFLSSLLDSGCLGSAHLTRFVEVLVEPGLTVLGESVLSGWGAFAD